MASNILNHYMIPDMEFIEIYIRVPTMDLAKRASVRGDSMEIFDKRFYEENEQFTQYEKSQILNTIF